MVMSKLLFRMGMALAVCLLAVMPALADTAAVLINGTNPAYTVYMTVGTAGLDKVRDQFADREGYQLVEWPAFTADPGRYLHARIIHDEYAQSGVETLVREFLEQVPGAPLALTWNGGVAFTAADFRAAEQRYQQYLADPSAYAAAHAAGGEGDVNDPAWLVPILHHK